MNRIRDLAGRGPLTAISAALAEEALYRVRQGFRGAVDPYGTSWRPLQRRSGRILRDTGRLQNSFARVRASRSGFVIGSNVDYADVHQYGASYTARGGSTSRKRGRFVSGQTLTKKGITKRGKLRKGFRQVSHGAHGVYIPPRRMLPLESLGLGTWAPAFARVTRRMVSRILKG
jgi:phage gpG-like protein